MYRFNNIKQGILIASFATFITGCGGGGSSATTSTGTTLSSLSPTSSSLSPTSSSLSPTSSSLSPTTVIPTQSSKAVQTGQVKNSVTGKGLKNVEVSIGSQRAITDANGFYTLSDLSESEEAVINFKKEGYLLGSTKIQIKELSEDNTPSTNYLEYSMYAHDHQWNHDSTLEISSSRIYIDTSVSYIQTKGSPYIGNMGVELTILDSKEDALLNYFPGSFEGINTNGQMVPFVSYGLISLTFKDDNGNVLNLTNDARATLTFNTVSSSEKDNIIPLWYYDYDQGLWFEEGYAELQSDGTYKGEISHSGTWSLNKPIETDTGIYKGRIIDSDGLPMSDVRLHAIGDNWISSDLTTDEDGVFEIEVIPGKSFQLSAYNYKDKYRASYNNTISAIASGDIAED